MCPGVKLDLNITHYDDLYSVTNEHSHTNRFGVILHLHPPISPLSSKGFHCSCYVIYYACFGVLFKRTVKSVLYR